MSSPPDNRRPRSGVMAPPVAPSAAPADDRGGQDGPAGQAVQDRTAAPPTRARSGVLNPRPRSGTLNPRPRSAAPPARPVPLDPERMHRVLERLVGAATPPGARARQPGPGAHDGSAVTDREGQRGAAAAGRGTPTAGRCSAAARPARPVTWLAYPKVRRFRSIKGVEPARGWALMRPALKRLKLDKIIESYLAMRAFDLVYGGVVRHRARAERYARKVLFIRAESSAWVQELSFLKEEILKKLNRTVGGLEIKDLRFTVGPIDDLPTWETPPPAPPPERPPYAPDPRVAGALTQVEDKELRERLADLYITACHAGR